MEYVTLNTGANMPLEGFGVFQIPDLKECEEVVYNVIKTGYRLLDTAAAYGNEEAVGKVLIGPSLMASRRVKNSLSRRKYGLLI